VNVSRRNLHSINCFSVAMYLKPRSRVWGVWEIKWFDLRHGAYLWKALIELRDPHKTGLMFLQGSTSAITLNQSRTVSGSIPNTYIKISTWTMSVSAFNRLNNWVSIRCCWYILLYLSWILKSIPITNNNYWALTQLLSLLNASNNFSAIANVLARGSIALL